VIPPKPPRTTEQPLRTVGRRWRDDKGQHWAHLIECGHDEPANDLPMATALRYRECNPVRVTPGLATTRDVGL
jgi:hypothetical protein